MGTPSNLHLIANPNAGNAQQLEALSGRVDALERAEIHLTERPGHAEELARGLTGDGKPTIVAVGGDGTIHEVVNGLLEASRPVRFGILPLGTGNDLCRALAIPDDPEAAFALLTAGETARIDVVRVRIAGRQRRFVNMSGAGFAAEVSSRASSDLKNVLGAGAYFWGALEALVELTEYPVELEFDGGERQRLDLVNLFVANGGWAAGGIPIAPTASLDDGLLDVVAVRSASTLELTAIAAKVALGQHLEDPGLIFRRTRSLTVTSERPLPFNLDGETGQIGREADTAAEITFEIEPRALEIVAGPQAPGLATSEEAG